MIVRGDYLVLKRTQARQAAGRRDPVPRLAPVTTASFAAARIDGAETLILDKGGHLLLGHHEAVGHSVAAFLAAHAGARGE